MANALAGETSPYLLQHQHNPVDWLPWGEPALARARELDRPLLVSIGYSACHWCHVMERECFEDEEIAAQMNEQFVCVKVDREERPDVDALYMEALQLMTGSGGWPLNVFVTPEQVPFYAGTYYPPEPRRGMPSWPTVLRRSPRRGTPSARRSARRTRRWRRGCRARRGCRPPRARSSDADPRRRRRPSCGIALRHDERRLGRRAEVPGRPRRSSSCCAAARRRMTIYTLRSMASGGIYDQIGGGFARYSVDVNWTVPHFEKMLYDNALLARAYLHGWQVSGGAEAAIRSCAAPPRRRSTGRCAR